MPNAWVEPEVFLEYGDVTIYHSYKDDDINRRMEYHYTVDIDENDDFDIRDLTEYLNGLPHDEVFRRAIDNKSQFLMDELSKLEEV